MQSAGFSISNVQEAHAEASSQSGGGSTRGGVADCDEVQRAFFDVADGACASSFERHRTIAQAEPEVVGHIHSVQVVGSSVGVAEQHVVAALEDVEGPALASLFIAAAFADTRMSVIAGSAPVGRLS